LVGWVQPRSISPRRTLARELTPIEKLRWSKSRLSQVASAWLRPTQFRCRSSRK
jgi:hypothetical protein